MKTNSNVTDEPDFNKNRPSSTTSPNSNDFTFRIDETKQLKFDDPKDIYLQYPRARAPSSPTSRKWFVVRFLCVLG